MNVDGDDAALAIIKQWGWDGNDPRFDFDVPYMMPLSAAINRLAMEGHADPAGAVLSLLADGRLEATGSYRWMTYRKGLFHRKGVGAIPAFRWAALKEAEDEPARPGIGKSIKLHLLGDEWGSAEVLRGDWSWQGDIFTTAHSSGRYWVAEGTSEEVYSAADIELRPSGDDNDIHENQNLLGSERNKGGAPSKYDWERAVAAVVFQWAEEGSWQPELQADVKKRLADWFADKDLHPSDSLLKERARWLFAEFQQRNGKADNLAA